MAVISDDEMRRMMGQAKEYCVVILRHTEKRKDAGADKIVWEHGRRNFSLHADGLLPIVCPVRDGSDISGVGVFNANVERTREIMEDDPGVKAGIFTFEVHPCRGFPGSCLP